ncbi:MAG: DUF4007 family protein, partial [Bacteroidota bacterium]|nr:DUF4007 family protein [Bacteroidota bacterium]
MEAIKYIFSGHDSFQCRQLWLKKGFDFVKDENNFNDEDAVVKLGVGKNMVSSIRFWLKAFNIIDNKDIPTEFGFRMFNENGYDPYLEDEASLWLLHYQLVKNGYASIYSIIFNEFRKEKQFFNKETYVNYIKRIGENNADLNINENTIAKDFIVFANLYKNDPESKDVEDSFSGILSEIELLKTTGKGKEEKFYIENEQRDNLPVAVVLFSILDNLHYGNSISLNSLEFDLNSPGAIFALNRLGLMNKISEIVGESKDITFTDQAGIKELQF